MNAVRLRAEWRCGVCATPGPDEVTRCVWRAATVHDRFRQDGQDPFAACARKGWRWSHIAPAGFDSNRFGISVAQLRWQEDNYRARPPTCQLAAQRAAG